MISLIILVLLKSEATTLYSKIYVATHQLQTESFAPARAFLVVLFVEHKRSSACLHCIPALQNQLRAEEAVKFPWKQYPPAFWFPSHHFINLQHTSSIYVCCAACLHPHVYSSLHASYIYTAYIS